MFSKFSRKGFTLIEILIVVAIIAILAGVVLVGLRGAGPQARDARRVADLRQIQNGLELFFNKTGSYPAAPGGAGGPLDWAALETALIAANVNIKSIPKSPRPPEYMYGTDSTGTSYVLQATLEEGDSKLTDNDLDGSIFGIDCVDPAYCVQL